MVIINNNVIFVNDKSNKAKDKTDFVNTVLIVVNRILDILKHYLSNPINAGKHSVENVRTMEGKIIDTRMNDLCIYTEKCIILIA